MNPDLFFQLHDLGATEQQIQWVINGAMPAEALLSQLQTPAQPQMPPTLPASEPVPVEPPPPPPVSTALAPPPPPPPPKRDDEVIVIPDDVTTPLPVVYDEPVNQVIPDDWSPEPVAKPTGESSMANYGPIGWAWDGLKWVAGGVAGGLASGISSTASGLVDAGPTRAQLGAPPAGGYRRTRRRRRRLLTCSDKADIAYLVGQLGQGQLGKAAISALLSKRCG